MIFETSSNWVIPIPPKGGAAIALVVDALARGLLYTCGITFVRLDRAMHIRALVGANVAHLFNFDRTLPLFQVAHVGGLF
jgi:hypothetical protein